MMAAGRKLLLIWLLLLPSAHAADIAFVNVNVVSMQGDRILREQTVLVRDQRIVSLGPVRDSAVPDEASIVDGTDRYLMPGLAEMHGHLPAGNSSRLERVLTLYAERVVAGSSAT